MTVEFTYPSQYPRFTNNAVATASAAPAQPDGEAPSFFGTLIDIVNPLQQLPVIGPIYRELTGDTLSPIARLAGGALIGGPIGFVVAAVNAALEADTGKDVTEHLFAMVGGGADEPVQVADAAFGTIAG